MNYEGSTLPLGAVATLDAHRPPKWKWWKFIKSFRGHKVKSLYDLYEKGPGSGSCCITNKYHWWLAKYGPLYTNKQREKARKELADAGVTNATTGKENSFFGQDLLLKKWQEKWAKDPKKKGKGNGGSYVLGPTLKASPKIKNFKYDNWKSWVKSLGSNPCCKLQKMVADNGDAVLLGYGSTKDSEGVSLMILAVDCDPKAKPNKGGAAKCKIVVMDYEGDFSPAILDLSTGTLTIQSDGDLMAPVDSNGMPSGSDSIGAGEGALQIKSVSIHT